MIPPEEREALLARIHAVPIVATLEMEIVALDEGSCSTRVPRKRIYDGIYRTFHGGLLMTIADTTACWAILTVVGAGRTLATTDMSIRFLAPCLTGVTAKARLIKRGRTLCPVAVDLFDESGVHVAVAQVAYMLLDAAGRPGSPPPEGSGA